MNGRPSIWGTLTTFAACLRITLQLHIFSFILKMVQSPENKTVVNLFQTVCFVNCIIFLQMYCKNIVAKFIKQIIHSFLMLACELNTIYMFQSSSNIWPSISKLLSGCKCTCKNSSMQNWQECHFQNWQIEMLQFLTSNKFIFFNHRILH